VWHGPLNAQLCQVRLTIIRVFPQSLAHAAPSGRFLAGEGKAAFNTGHHKAQQSFRRVVAQAAQFGFRSCKHTQTGASTRLYAVPTVTERPNSLTLQIGVGPVWKFESARMPPSPLAPAVQYVFVKIYPSAGFGQFSCVSANSIKLSVSFMTSDAIASGLFHPVPKKDNPGFGN